MSETETQAQTKPPKPLLMGYQKVRLSTTDTEMARDQVMLSRYAQREGYELVAIYVERDVNQRDAALAALIAAALERPVAAIAVPRSDHLGLHASVRLGTRKRLEETGARVIVVHDEDYEY